MFDQIQAEERGDETNDNALEMDTSDLINLCARSLGKTITLR